MQTIRNIISLLIFPFAVLAQTNQSNIIVEKKAPLILFEYNSVVPSNKKPLYETENLNFNAAIQHLFNVLQENPKMTLEIGGHADIKESDPKRLSKKRAKLVFNELVKLGVNKKRLNVVGHSNSKPQRSENMIEMEKTDADKEALRLYNRRVICHIITFGE
jgi:outer membrane protein OmpA-like peptidoglycan-associated protein